AAGGGAPARPSAGSPRTRARVGRGERARGSWQLGWRRARSRQHRESPGADATGLAQTGSGQLADADVLEVDRRALGLQAQVAGPRLDAVAPGHLLAVDPQAQLPVDRPHVVVVPLPEALAQVLAREAAAAVGR